MKRYAGEDSINISERSLEHMYIHCIHTADSIHEHAISAFALI